MHHLHLTFAAIDILYYTLLLWFALKRCFSRAKIVRLAAILLTVPSSVPLCVCTVSFIGILLQGALCGDIHRTPRSALPPPIDVHIILLPFSDSVFLLALVTLSTSTDCWVYMVLPVYTRKTASNE